MVGCSDYEGAEGAWRELHEVDGDYTPSALNTELFEEGSCDDGVGRGEGVWVEEGATDDGYEDDGESATEDLRAVSNDCST